MGMRRAAILGAVLNFTWEMLQMPLYRGMQQKPLWIAALICLEATIADLVILFAAYWLIAWRKRTWHWMPTMQSRDMLRFTMIALAISTAIELIATKVFHRYAYNSRMPIVPVLDIGVTPLLQWVLLPPVVLLLARYTGKKHVKFL